MRRTTHLLPLLLLAACGMRGPAALGPAESSAPATLQPGDVVSVSIWREEDLSGRFTVREDGYVTLPLIGARRVTSIPVEQLRDTLIDAYRRDLRNPSIEVTPLRTVLLLGAVAKPGPYEVNPITTVLGAVALAGGATASGSVAKIDIRRGGEVVASRVSPGATLSELGVRSGDEVFLGDRSWLARNQAYVVSVLLALPSAIYALSRIN